MTWKLQAKPSVGPCTRQLIEEFAHMEPAPHDRPFNENRAKFLTRLIVSGTFRVANFASVYCKETRKTYRVNGKHTATVLAELNGSHPKELCAVVERYHADAMADVAALYATFDHKRSLRTSGDINAAFAAAHTDLADLRPKIVNVCATGLAFAEWEYECFKHEADERAGLLLTHHAFVAWVAGLFPSNGNHRHLLRSSVIAAMFRTFEKNRRQATEFWRLVAEESHPANNHPTRVLARWLLTHGLHAGATQKQTQGLDSVRGMYVRCLLAWNAWRAGRDEVALRFSPQTETPLVA